ncbi:MAG: response regulator transcription factor [Pseudolabrys sp.]
MTAVLIVDDHPILLQGCKRVLEDMGIDTVIEARDIAGGYRLYRRQRPDMVIVDLSFQGSSLAGLPLVQRIRRHDPQARILVLSMHSDPAIVMRALQAGATGYAVKDCSPEELVKAIVRVRDGLFFLNDALAGKVVFGGTQRGPLDDLTPRELQTLALLAEGKAYDRIAKDLNVSYKTVVNTCWQLRQKLAVRNLPELVRAAVQLLTTA